MLHIIPESIIIPCIISIFAIFGGMTTKINNTVKNAAFENGLHDLTASASAKVTLHFLVADIEKRAGKHSKLDQGYI